MWVKNHAVAAMASSLLLANGASTFLVPKSSPTALSKGVRPSDPLHLNVPRLPLPDAVGDKLEEFDLKNPNTMDAAAYNAYSGAAIGGTLLFFLVPGALVSGIFGSLGAVLVGAVVDFLFSALVGGGTAIYLSVRKDDVGAKTRAAGNKVYDFIKESGLPMVPRQTSPDAVDEKLSEFGLMSINGMTDEEYDGYAGAAVFGTLLCFFTPGLIISGLPSILTEDFLPAAFGDFVLSALIGGGAAIYLSLRKDELGETVSGYGTKLIDTVDGVLGSD